MAYLQGTNCFQGYFHDKSCLWQDSEGEKTSLGNVLK